MSAKRIGSLMCAAVLSVSACSPGSPFPTPFASEHEVPRHVLADMLAVQQQDRYGYAPVTVSCDRGVAPGSGRVAVCTLVHANGYVETFGVSLTSDQQLISQRG